MLLCYDVLMSESTSPKAIRIPISTRRLLKKRLKSTHKTIVELFTDTELPEGLNSEYLYSFFHNNLRDMRDDYLSAIMLICNENFESGEYKTDNDYIDKIQTEIKRTNISPTEMVKRNKRMNRNPMVTMQSIYNWINGRYNKADYLNLSRAVDLYAEIPASNQQEH